MGSCEDFQMKGDFRRIKLKVKALELVASISASGSYSLKANNVNACLCLIKGDYYEVITPVIHVNFSH